MRQLDRDPLLDRDPDPSRTSGPFSPVVNHEPTYVPLTIDSMGDDDPVLAAYPDLSVVFVFN